MTPKSSHPPVLPSRPAPWGQPGVWPARPAGGPEWFEQMWFAGCHSDIGGSYVEDESRLSDISLGWMLETAKKVGLKCDDSVLQLYPDPTGMQHDETRSFPFKYAAKLNRTILAEAPLHPSVIERLNTKEVLQYDLYERYSPVNLNGHKALPQ